MSDILAQFESIETLAKRVVQANLNPFIKNIPVDFSPSDIEVILALSPDLEVLKLYTPNKVYNSVMQRILSKM